MTTIAHMLSVPVAREPSAATASLFVSPLAGTRGLLALFSTHPPKAERTRRVRALALSAPPMTQLITRRI